MTEAGAAFDTVDDRLIAQFRATLAAMPLDWSKQDVPLGLHWCLFPPLAETLALAPDGHPPRILAVDPVAYPRRMWVGGTLAFGSPLRRGQSVRRLSSPLPLDYKNGRSGALCLTGIDHCYMADDGVLLDERQTIAFRGPTAVASRFDADPAEWSEAELIWRIETPATLLFRYSAITFNSHRIHYDSDYARTAEGYRGTLVHGPLQATILLNLSAALLGRTPERFSYRAVRPMVAGSALVATGRIEDGDVHCAIRSPDGVIHMTGKAR